MPRTALERLNRLQTSLEDFSRRDVDLICRIKLVEGLKWEFKTRPETDLNKLALTKEERVSLGKIVSGFANSDGGVVVYGIQSKRDEGVDRAEAKAPVANLRVFVASLEASLGSIVSPPVAGLEIKALISGNAGFVGIRIPKSDRRPHMSIAGGEYKYYYRDSIGFNPMQHFQVEDSFNRRRKPTFAGAYMTAEKWREIRYVGAGNATYVAEADMHVAIALVNKSDVSAESISAKVAYGGKLKASLFQPSKGFFISHWNESEIIFHSDGGVVLNPESTIPICRFPMIAKRENPEEPFRFETPFTPETDHLLLNLEVSCRDTRPAECDCNIDLGSLKTDPRLLAER